EAVGVEPSTIGDLHLLYGSEQLRHLVPVAPVHVLVLSPVFVVYHMDTVATFLQKLPQTLILIHKFLDGRSLVQLVSAGEQQNGVLQ
ncbi:hypothetical protein NQD34_018467, partial [Periophthalmus magnuspinnatus]